MRWLVRADASVTLGAGHIARCLTLARQARTHGVQVKFVCRDLTGALMPGIRQDGFTAHTLGAQEDDAAATSAVAADGEAVQWLVVDHYALDASWERRVQGAVANIMVIDDLANRPHDWPVLLDQNFWPDAAARYLGLVQPIACNCWAPPTCCCVTSLPRRAPRCSATSHGCDGCWSTLAVQMSRM